MRRFTIGTLSALALTGLVAPTALADTHVERSEAAAEQLSAEDITAFELTYLAFRGEFEEYGIPAGQFLVQEYRDGEVTAESIVTTAVDHNYVNEDVLDNSLYVDQVGDFLQMLESHDS
ncbi:hypothetical protein XM38_021930 [Halomicronema hongdechloris C2206]|uniref:Uncharacterized protein n=1 Tax=Halomicronema hongdechloris C2206 TaxID=1641165 RepID=A0A1Z3HLR1_9CYAN|nr:hypothetical protein [Halomicronema hongdechloris]ASC71241.1 hypothetical protein XM38_021930 [Halomicronema hongdechloris C2206]